MRQLQTIEDLKSILESLKGVEMALLIGSFGRGDANPNSDIDIQLLVDGSFDKRKLIEQLKNLFSLRLLHTMNLNYRKKAIAYFSDMPKLEIQICNSISEIKTNYLGSRIKDIQSAWIYGNQNAFEKLKGQVSEWSKEDDILSKAEKVQQLANKFIYYFESFSAMHRRSDAYQAYLLYNNALHTSVQLYSISKGHNEFNYLPKRFVSNILDSDFQKNFYQLNGTLFLPEVNSQKRQLLTFFYKSISPLMEEDEFEKIKTQCEFFFRRDYYWNFRDISKNNPRIQKGMLFRSATLAAFQANGSLDQILNENRIRSIIDLRAVKEVEDLPYDQSTMKKIEYVRAPLDPWNQPQWFKDAQHQGTNDEIAYKFFCLGCKDEIKRVMETIIDQNEGGIAIHCVAGKDRTGIMVSLLHLLVDTPIEIIYQDYLESEVDTRKGLLDVALEIVKEKGGVEAYLKWCGLSEDQITTISSLSGVQEFPMRIKCATMAWHTLLSALEKKN